MMNLEYDLNKIVFARRSLELRADAAHYRLAKEIAAEQTTRTSIIARIAGMLKRQTTERPARPACA